MVQTEEKKPRAKAKGEPSGKGEPIQIALSADEAILWIGLLWKDRNADLHGTEKSRDWRGKRIDAIEALVRQLGVETAEPTVGEDKLYVHARLDVASLLRRVAGTDRRTWARNADAAPPFRASVDLADEAWFAILAATTDAALAPTLLDVANTEVFADDDYEEEAIMAVELLGGIFYALREASPRNRDLFERWLRDRLLDMGSERWALLGEDVPYGVWRRLVLNRLLSVFC